MIESGQETQPDNKNRLFYLYRNFYGSDEVMLVVAENRKRADEMFGDYLKTENYPHNFLVT
jgi:hypothetical protein